MKVERTKLDGVRLITPASVFTDHRGSYVELHNVDRFRAAGIAVRFVEDDISVSAQGVLRGIHGNATTWKLVSCLEGSFFLAVVNFDATSPQFLQWEAFTLSEENRLQVLVPPKHGNGHAVLSERAIFHYKQSETYDSDSQFTLRWDDPRLGIDWPVKDPILSVRDRDAEFLDAE